MGNIDAAAKECFSDNTKFADLCNAVLFSGEQVVIPEQLTEKDTKSNAEFLSGFTKTDKLVPIITITVYLGCDEWDAPRCLADMYEVPDERLRPYLQDFNANLFVPSEFNDFDKFQTELKQIFEILSASGDEQKMKRVLSEDSKFQAMDNETVRIINDIAGTKFPLTEKGQVNNMVCKAWEDHYQSGRLSEIFSSVQEGDYSISRGAQKADMSIEQFEKAMTEAGYKLPAQI